MCYVKLYFCLLVLFLDSTLRRKQKRYILLVKRIKLLSLLWKVGKSCLCFLYCAHQDTHYFFCFTCFLSSNNLKIWTFAKAVGIVLSKHDLSAKNHSSVVKDDSLRILGPIPRGNSKQRNYVTWRCTDGFDSMVVSVIMRNREGVYHLYKLTFKSMKEWTLTDSKPTRIKEAQKIG